MRALKAYCIDLILIYSPDLKLRYDGVFIMVWELWDFYNPDYNNTLQYMSQYVTEKQQLPGYNQHAFFTPLREKEYFILHIFIHPSSVIALFSSG